MAEDRIDERAASTREPGEDEATAVRRARYGRLPRHPEPAELVETVDIASPHDDRQPIEPRREWGV